MQVVLTTSQMREADRSTITDFGIPGFTLMETAGRGAVLAITEWFGPLQKKRVCLLCGKGNNGGDALVVARCLVDAGAHVTVRLAMGIDDLSQDAAANLRLLEQLQSAEPARLHIAENNGDIDLDSFDLLIDGLLGTGVQKKLREPLLSLVEVANYSRTPVVALDIPTGLHGDTGEVLGAAIRAGLTVTMAAPKLGLFLSDGPDYAGEIVVADVGIPDAVLQSAARMDPGPTYIPSGDDIRARLPSRRRADHKYSAGLALVVAGSEGLTGAPVMASTAAARVGAGAVVCATARSVRDVVASKLTEVMTLSLPEGADGIDAPEAIEALKERLGKARSMLVGCGLGRARGTAAFVRRLIETAVIPVVVDADGLHALARDTAILAGGSHGARVLTPHKGELRSLVGDEVDTLGPLEIARKYAARWHCVMVIKGAPTVVGTPDGTTFINQTGNQALASAGTGDVLAGMITGYLAQGLSPVDAALCSLYIGGRAADVYAARMNRDSLMAMDLVNELPELLKREFAL